MGDSLYKYVKVIFSNDTYFEYSYLDLTGDVKVGDYVWVPAGRYNETKSAYVVSVGEYTKDNAPYPPERTKSILRVATDEETERFMF